MKNKITRRSCLQLLGLCALGAAAGVSLAMPSRFGQTESRISRSQRALGTHVDISAIGHAQAIEDAMGAKAASRGDAYAPWAHSGTHRKATYGTNCNT